MQFKLNVYFFLFFIVLHHNLSAQDCQKDYAYQLFYENETTESIREILYKKYYIKIKNADACNYLLSLNYYLNNKINEIERISRLQFQSHSYKEKVYFLLALSYYKDRKIEKAKTIIQPTQYNTLLNQNMNRIEEQLKDKEYAQALSSYLPGIGFVECEEKTKAFYAASLNTLFIGSTLYAYNQKAYFLSFLFLFIELGFYKGSINAAGECVDNYNRKIIQQETKNLLKHKQYFLEF